MSIQQQQTGSSHLIRISGRLDQAQTPQLEAVLNSLLEASHYHFIIELTETTYINSGGLRSLVSAWRKARQQAGNLILFGLNERLQEIFSMVGFDKVFQIYPDAAAAREAMQKIVNNAL